MNTHPVRYLVIRIMSKRAFGVLLPFWVICLVVFVFLAYLMRRANVRLLFIRKVFHLLALCLFIPGIMVDPSFMSIAFSCAFGLFLLIEATPAAWIAPMRRFMQEFTDERDNRGKLILTHVYLLMGCGMSLWIYGDNRGHRLILYSGLLALGVGDTMACIAGVLFGRHRITKTTSKTWEGFAANFISVFAAAWCLAYLCGDIIRPVRLLSAALFSAGIEASCPHLDNLVLPLFAHIFFAVSTM
jgi:dolichol kinase